MLIAMAAAGSRDASLTILFVLGSPEERPSTDRLLASLSAIKTWSTVNQTSVHLHVWYLRSKPEQNPWPNTFVVDSLRTFGPARALEWVRLDRPAAGVRGRLLAARWRRVAPDIVVFDDGVGDRIIPAGEHPIVVDRVNVDCDEFSSWEPPEQHQRSLIWATAGADPATASHVGSTQAPVVWEPDFPRRFDAARAMRAQPARMATRQRLGVEGQLPLVVGWGRDGWSDAPELIMRALWVLEHRHNVAASGLWLGPGLDDRTTSRLLADAERAGLGGRLTFAVTDGVAERCCGDAIFLPHRSPDIGVDLVPEAIAGCRAVVFWPDYADPSIASLIDVVAPLDLEAAAAALAAALTEPRSSAIAAASSVDFDDWFDILAKLVVA